MRVRDVPRRICCLRIAAVPRKLLLDAVADVLTVFLCRKAGVRRRVRIILVIRYCQFVRIGLGYIDCFRVADLLLQDNPALECIRCRTDSVTVAVIGPRLRDLDVFRCRLAIRYQNLTTIDIKMICQILLILRNCERDMLTCCLVRCRGICLNKIVILLRC